MPLSKLFADRIHHFTELSFMEAYALFDAPISEYDPPALETLDMKVKANGEEVPILVYRPVNITGLLPVIIWMHGGGFQRGSYTMNEGAVAGQELAHQGNFLVINVEYRLVTETVKFPAPQDDCMAVLSWVHENIESLGGNPEQIFVGGVSAGGCLAASVAVLDRDLGNHLVAGQLLNCPIIHTALPEMSDELSAKMREIPKELGFTPELIDQLNRFVVASGNIEDILPAWLPGESSNLAGLPPAQVINCEYDTLRASGEKYAAQLLAAGVEVELLTQAGVPHAHLNRVPEDCPEVGETIDRIIGFVNRVSGRS